MNTMDTGKRKLSLGQINWLGLVGALIVGAGGGYTTAYQSGVTDPAALAKAAGLGALGALWAFFVQRSNINGGAGLLPGLTSTDAALVKTAGGNTMKGEG